MMYNLKFEQRNEICLKLKSFMQNFLLQDKEITCKTYARTTSALYSFLFRQPTRKIFDLKNVQPKSFKNEKFKECNG